MSPSQSHKPRRTLKLSRETIRNLEDQAMVKFGPQTSERIACCPTVDTNGDPVTSY
jgi:hypothetical protein